MTAAAEQEEPLPDLLARVADVAGEAVAHTLAQAFGGTTIYIPAKPTEKGPLARAVGLKAAEAIAREIGFGDVTIPLGPNASHAHVRRAIRALGALSETEVARKLGCHERTVRRVRRTLRVKETPPLLKMMGRRSA